MTTPPKTPRPVSHNNPCPFLRALVAQGQLADDTAPLHQVAQVIASTARKGEGQPKVPSALVYGIALGANGIGPLSLLQNQRGGLRLNQLRNGPLDKKGVGSGLLDRQGKVSLPAFERLRGFAQTKTASDGSTELGLGLPELVKFMDANFARASGTRRRIDRALMNGEWPILLKVMGKNGPDGRYLSLAEVKALFVKRQLPQRMRAPV